MEKPLAAALLVNITNTTLHLGDWVGLWWFADWLIKPRRLSALTGRLLIWRGVRTRISAFHRLAGTSRPANHVTAGPVLQERRGMGQESMCLLLMLCACQSRPFSSQFSAFLFLVLSVVSLSSGSACPNDAWQRETADHLSSFNSLYPAYCMSITCFFSNTLSSFFLFSFQSEDTNGLKMF